MPLRNLKREDGTENNFTFEKLVNYIENEKVKSVNNSEYQFRLVHSDQSGQLMKSNSVRQSHASILSPSFSLGYAIE